MQGSAVIIDKIRHLLRSGKKPGGRSRNPAGPPDLDAHIRKIVASRAQGAAGRLQIISLDKIRQSIPAAEWAGLMEKVQTTVTSVILRRLGPRDSFTQTENNSFLIVFDGLTRADAELECVLIVQEVMRTLFAGRQGGEAVDIRSVAVGLDGQVAVEDVDLLAIIGRLLREEQEKKDAEKNDTVSAVPVSVAPADEAETFEAIMKGLPDRPMSFEYRPLWDVRRKVLSAYSCVVVENRDFGAAVSVSDASRNAALDFLAIGRVTHELRRLNSAGRRLLMQCPVHIDTLCEARTWATYRILCERIAHTPMRRELIFEITGIAPETERDKIARAGARLTGLCRHVIARADADTDLSNFKGAPLAYLCMAGIGSRQGEKRLMKMMDDYAENAQAMGFGAIATGLNSLSLVTAAVASGFDMIGGDAIHAPITRPEFVYRFEARHFLAKLSG